MSHLCRERNAREVRRSLDILPTGIYAFYEDAIKRIEDQPEGDRQLAKRVLSYIFRAKRPLNLEELRHALTIEDGDTELDETAFPETEIILNTSVGLISVDEQSSTTGLVHHTLQQYLEKHHKKVLPESDVEFARACLTYLSFGVFGKGSCSNEEAVVLRLQEYCFFDYASHNWGYHVINNQLHGQMDLLSEFLEDKQKLSSFVQVLYIPRYRMKDWHDRFPKQFSPLHVVAYWGLDKFLITLLQEGIDINSQDSYGATALHLAAQRNHTAVVRLLVEKGAKVDMTNNRRETALFRAVRNGHKMIVELLLVKGANVLAEDYEGWTALDWAVIGGYNELVKMLLDQWSTSTPQMTEETRRLF